MNKVLVLIGLICVGLFISGCSSMKRSAISGAFLGGIAGALGGSIFTPKPSVSGNKEKNAFLFGSIAALVGSGIGYLIYEKPLDQRLQNQMILEESEKNEIPFIQEDSFFKGIKREFKLRALKKYEVPLENLPENLKGKAKKQFVMEYLIPEEVIDLDNRTITVEEHKAYENMYE